MTTNYIKKSPYNLKIYLQVNNKIKAYNKIKNDLLKAYFYLKHLIN